MIVGMGHIRMVDRFRGFLPVVVDVETSGVNPSTHGILEIGAVFLNMVDGQLQTQADWRQAVSLHPDTTIDPSSLQITGIDLDNRTSKAISEHEALKAFFKEVRDAMKAAECTRALLVGHNSSFDHQFIDAASTRNRLKRNPFHPFTSIDTASLAAVTFGHTVLREVCVRAGIEFDPTRAHGALYDAQITADLFCKIVNAWDYIPPVAAPAASTTPEDPQAS